MLDTKGPEIRTGKLDPSCNGKLALKRGNTIEIGTDYERLGTPEYLACSYRSLAATVSVGAKMLVADGSLILQVVQCNTDSVIAEIMNDAVIGEKKNMNRKLTYFLFCMGFIHNHLCIIRQ
jgi:pyruvate kinase